MSRSREYAGVSRPALILTACLAVLGCTINWSILPIAREFRMAAETADRVLAAFQVRPKVVSSRRTLVEQQSDVLQMVTTEKTVTEKRRIDDSWLHSTKTLEVEADFVVRVGFDLAKPFVIDIDRTATTLRVTLPPAEILSVDLRDVRFTREEDGFWNKLNPADREQALRALRDDVERRMKKSDLTSQARASAEKRLADLLASGGRRVIFEPERKP